MSKIAFITGANRGLGLETARQLARDFGFTVVLGSRDVARGQQAQELLKSEGLDARYVLLDVVDESQIEAAKQFVDETFKRVDVLVNNAGIMLEHTSHVDCDLGVWRQTFDSNLFGAVGVTGAFLPLLEKSESPRVVNVSAILGSLSEISKPQMKTWIRASYSASKAGLNAFTVALAQEKSGSNWKINAAHPGWAKTEMGGPQAPMTVAQGVKTVVQLATLESDGPSGGFFHAGKMMNW